MLTEKLRRLGIVPVVRIEDSKDAVSLANALSDGGLPIVEITFRSDAAIKSIEYISKECPDVLVGAGTVISLSQLDMAIDAGASFVVTPGFNETVVKACIDKGIPIFPGCTNPNDIESAMSLGINIVKFFPAEHAGGIQAIKALSAPYSNINFLPTGGINIKNLNDYLSFSRVIACGGSWMVDTSLISSGNFAEITRLTIQAVRTMLGLHLSDINVYYKNDEDVEKTAKTLESLFLFEYKAERIFHILLNSSEKAGCFDIGTGCLKRAEYHLRRQNIPILEVKNNMIILDIDLNGFSVRLVKNREH